MNNNSDSILGKKLNVITIGVSTFAEDLRKQGIEVLDLDWRPPAGGNPEMANLLEKLGF
jgi:hypothetical protein